MADPPSETCMEAPYADRSIYSHKDGLDPEDVCLSPLYPASCVKGLLWVCFCLNPTNHQPIWVNFSAIHNRDVSVALCFSLS